MKTEKEASVEGKSERVKRFLSLQTEMDLGLNWLAQWTAAS